MASVLEKMATGEGQSTGFWNLKGGNIMVDTWPLMGSPVPVLTIMAAYFLLVAIGPKLMKNKPAMKLTNTIFYYNLFQIMCSAFLCVQIVLQGIFKNGFLLGGCHIPLRTNDVTLLLGTYMYFLMKISELLDTVFFVLRKKNNQVTFLHVYHHATMVLYMWSYLKYAAAGDGPVLAFLNCFVHVVMYSYYLLASLGPKFQKYLWWKKYVTELQLVQFMLMLFYLIYTHFQPGCKFSTFSTGFITANVSIYLVLFLNFYFRTFKRDKATK